MKPTDDLILELLEEEGQFPPKLISDKIDRHQTYVNTRCIELRDYGLLRNIGQGIYQITEEGEKYLDGELDANELEKSTG